MINLKKVCPIIFLLFLWGSALNAENLKLHYQFETVSNDDTQVIDATTNKNNGTLKNGATVRMYGSYSVLDLGADDGYLDMGASVGDIMATLNDFTIESYLYIDASTNLYYAGNFVWAFGNSNNIANDANGAYFYSAKSSRYAISKTHWQGEQSVIKDGTFPQGRWKHVAYTQVGNRGIMYIDGEEVASDDIAIKPSDIGATAYNYIGRSVYRNDAYLANALLYDFKIYDKGLSATEVASSAQELKGLNAEMYMDQLKQWAETIDIPDTTKTDLVLQNEKEGMNALWSSSHSNISTDGNVDRPAYGSEPVEVTLTAVFSIEDTEYQHEYKVVVLPFPSDEVAVAYDLEALSLDGNYDNLRTSLTLPMRGVEGSGIAWESTALDFMSNSGDLLQLSPKGSGKKALQLNATVTKGHFSSQRTFNISIAEDDGFSSYLFSYFTGNSGDQEAIRFALSHNGYCYWALNEDKPIISSLDISSTGGVRDPHILRGPHGHFYMVVTDMVSANGWSSNRAMVLLKSSDLINWTSHVVNIQTKYEGQDDLERVWAPQTIYDEAAGKFMLYWSMKYTGGPDIIYYAYANNDFTDIEGVPQQLFYHPENESCIDGDIILKDGVYNLFFKTEGNGNGIKKAVSDNLTDGYVLVDKYLQQTSNAVEGSSIFRMINSDKYILMYDMYSSGKYQFTESYDLANFVIVDNDVAMDFHPRHGTVMPITELEAQKLTEEWASADNLQIFEAKGDFIIADELTIDNIKRQVSIAIDGGDLEAYNPQLVAFPGVSVSPAGPVDFSHGPVTYTLSIAGIGTVNYQVEVTSEITIDEQVTKTVSHQLYPNPAHSYINVEMPNDYLANTTLQIYDISGLQVLSTRINSKLTTISIMHLNASPYFMVSTMDDKVLWSEKFIVK